MNIKDLNYFLFSFSQGQGIGFVLLVFMLGGTTGRQNQEDNQ